MSKEDWKPDADELSSQSKRLINGLKELLQEFNNGGDTEGERKDSTVEPIVNEFITRLSKNIELTQTEALSIYSYR